MNKRGSEPLAFDFTAKPQTLGYMYQFLYALLLVFSADETATVAVESLDDIAFEMDGTAIELVQVKHRAKEASLTDGSVDLWKAVRVWSTLTRAGKIVPQDIRLLLVTTAAARAGSIAAHLRGEEGRDVRAAVQKMEQVARTSENTVLAKAFASFRALSSLQRQQVVAAITVVDRAPRIEQAEARIREFLRPASLREHRDAVYDRFVGWWFGRVVQQLRTQGRVSTSAVEIFDRIRLVADQFGPSALPIDFLEEAPDSIDPQHDSRVFVQQLKCLGIRNRRIEKAIVDYYRASMQRSRWARETLLGVDELEGYERRLVDEWERYSDSLADSEAITDPADPEQRRIGCQILDWMEFRACVRIREDVREPYVMRGSYHMLADEEPPRVWWHPQFLRWLSEASSSREKAS